MLRSDGDVSELLLERASRHDAHFDDVVAEPERGLGVHLLRLESLVLHAVPDLLNGTILSLV